MVTRSPARGPLATTPAGLVAEDQRRGPARVMAVIGVHVRAADADRLDLAPRTSSFEGAGSGSSRRATVSGRCRPALS